MPQNSELRSNLRPLPIIMPEIPSGAEIRRVVFAVHADDNGPRISEFYNKLRFLPIIGRENSSGFNIRRIVSR